MSDKTRYQYWNSVQRKWETCNWPSAEGSKGARGINHHIKRMAEIGVKHRKREKKK